jgi:hypothetical protein
LFPRFNTALSAYLKSSRCRTGTSVALAVAAAAGVGASATAAGSGPWSASLNSMVLAGHAATGSAGDTAGKNVFDAVAGSRPASHPAAKHAAPANGKQAAPRQSQGTGQPAQVTGRQQPASGGTGHAQPDVMRALPPLPAHPAAPARHPAPATVSTPAPPKPYTIYDSVTPTQIPSNQQQVAVYGNGSYQASWSDVHGRHSVLWIDTNGSNPGCNVLDVEPGNATPANSAQWVKARLAEQPNSIAIVYTMRSDWSQVKGAIGSLPGQLQSHVRYWIADPTGVPHIVPGSSATQWYWGANYDITKALPNFES